MRLLFSKWFAHTLVPAMFLFGLQNDGLAASDEVKIDTVATHLIIQFQASEQKLNEFLAIMDTVDQAMESEPGFISAQVYRDLDNPLKFTLVEAWSTRRLHEQHFQRINQSGDWDHILSLLSSKPVMGYHKIR